MSTLSGWCSSHGVPDQWHDACTSATCSCPNHQPNEEK